VSLLFAVMGASIGAFALQTARTKRRSTRGRWFPIAVGTVLIAFAFSFIVVGFLMRLEPSIFFSWMSSYFVLCAVFMLWLAFRAHSRGAGQSGQVDPFLPAPSPIHTH
jgi:undecaprenyl pyrophosphate phosphatase UppP